MQAVYRKLFKSKAAVESDNVKSEAAVESDNNVTVSDAEEVQRPPVTRVCSHCHQSDHTIRQCVVMNTALREMVDYCTSNATNIPKVRTYLNTIDAKVVFRYTATHKLRHYLYTYCPQYYDNNCVRGTRLNNNIELIIGYLCVLPLNPQMKVKREKSKTSTTAQQQDDFLSPHMYIGMNGQVGLGLKLL